MNSGMNLPALQRIMQDFEMESEAMDMKEEMMSDAVDDVMMDEEDEEEEELVVRQVLDEIGVQLDQEVSRQNFNCTQPYMKYILLVFVVG